jgi:hypothetical protein
MRAHLSPVFVLVLVAVTGGAACSLLADEKLKDKRTEAKAGDDAGGGGAGGAAPSAGPSCAPWRGDCDGEPKNGCEAHLDTSPQHCGACGHACPAGQKCEKGECKK